MSYARHIGRVGALAVTLGVGWAVASAPGVAFADTSGDASSSSSSSSESSSAEKRSEKTPGKGAGKGNETNVTGRDSADDPATDPDEDPDEDAEQDSAAAPDTSPEETVDAGSDDTEDDTAAHTEADEPDAGEADVETDAVNPKPAKRHARVHVVADAVDEILTPRPESPVSPLEGSTVLGSLAAVRDELERNTLRRSAAAQPQTAALVADDTPNVLVIGVDGTNLGRVLADPTGTPNFFGLMQSGTTAPSTIVGHTTISNPSWSSILTGAWGETTGVINNVFTPWTYSKWPTVYTQLETADPEIETTSIANWDVISGIADTGVGADNILNVAQVEGDTNWLLTDDRVGDLTEAAIAAASASTANFMFSYFVGVDENGHLYGGDSPEYAAAIRNFDRNLGEIMTAVDDWESATGEQWTIIMVTDHGHQPQQGVGHGFQSPDETSTFVIAENPDLFKAGAINLKYSIVDVTPTVMTLFGFEPAEDSEGVPLTDLGDADVIPVDNEGALRTALLDVIGKYGYPDAATNFALGVRTVFTSIPYFVYNFTTGTVAQLQSIADEGTFLISQLAALAIVPVQLIGDLTYVATNVVAQIVARLTGVTGASILPLWPPAQPTFPDAPEESSTPDLLAVGCSDGRVTSALFSCGGPAVAV